MKPKIETSSIAIEETHIYFWKSTESLIEDTMYPVFKKQENYLS